MKSFSNSIDKIPRPSIKTRGTPFSKGGFTLIEMIVALGIFSIVAVVALGALVKIISANKKAQTLQASITNLNFALDAMSRELRTGTAYYCDNISPQYTYNGKNLNAQLCNGGYAGSSVNSQVGLAFKSSKTATDDGGCNLAYAYRFIPSGSNWSLQKATQQKCAEAIINNETDSNGYSNILDPNVTISGYYISVVKAAADPYPRATIRISGYAGTKEKEKTYFDVQTTVAARSQ